MTKQIEGYVQAANVNSAVNAMRHLLGENREGRLRGIYSVCSANQLVLEAAFAQAASDTSLLLIEATCNQVNQDGGYTGLTPEQFRDHVHSLASEAGFPEDRLILGGDHLGPNPWRSKPAHEAMEKAAVMIQAFTRAGFTKIHLDASMRCADDPEVLSDTAIAERAARMCELSEAVAADTAQFPVYIVGTEVPTPGGAQGELEVAVTSVSSVQRTLDVHREAFERRGLTSAWERVVGVVVQPGVEFGDESIADYVPQDAQQLSEWILGEKRIIFEAHSTDYQAAHSLKQLVRGHFAILKVGPELTFAMREAVFGLARVEEEWIADTKRSDIRVVLEQEMLEHPENWKGYYRGDSHHLKIARAYSLSDRIRYYWPNAGVVNALSVLTQNLLRQPAPLPLIAQYLPFEAEAIRRKELLNDPHAMIRHRIRRVLARYSHACGSAAGRL
ncbi:D-tagatose-bisphosphate aldolase, class II, non-catalytic subunit [Terracidiphilus sp.]|jgi:D-tagatose-1,6-bisphosphate aldolase subunit GatZ/KbaZ|uniref:D-tagatose-bisphosphate aldolase, class II, non-catalytic subunit n=1 Tax=Terracidiphilus sp. TaxID=1964191 RepID=UPI003C2A9BA6